MITSDMLNCRTGSNFFEDHVSSVTKKVWHVKLEIKAPLFSMATPEGAPARVRFPTAT